MESDVTTTRMTEITCCAHKKSCCSKRLQHGLTLFFFTGTVGLLVVLLWRELVYHRSVAIYPYPETLEEMVLKQFPGYFRTQEQQDSFATDLIMLNVKQPIPVNQSIFDPQYQCSINCTGTISGKKKRAAVQGTYASGSTFNGCCVSNQYWTSNKTMRNIKGANRTIVHFPERKQFFLATNCSVVLGCTGCKCMQEQLLATAVVLVQGVTSPTDIKHFEIDFFYIVICCTCRNV